jgi:NADPH2 dehydrogenase
LDESYTIMTDDEIDELIETYIKAAALVQKAGFDFVDIKHCHGYLGHEFLSAFNRKGKYGGTFENRTRFIRNIVEGIKKNVPGLEIGVRLSSFDFVPFKKGIDDIGIPDFNGSNKYESAFGCTSTGLTIDLKETKAFLALTESLGIQLVCITAASPYYNPHLMRPALFPPSDGYSPPEEPLAGVARLIQVTETLKKDFPSLLIVGSGYSYLQEWLPNVGQYVLRNKKADFIGMGRMVLSYPTMADDILNGRLLERKHICRTFSDCTTAPRNGIISGCYPLDLLYKNLPQAAQLKEIKKEL